MSHATYLIGDVFDRMAELPDNSVDLVLTSPPFLALRSYLPEDHPDKAKEIGSEPNPAEFVDTLLALSAEWRRVLAPHGSIAVELGDTFSSGSGGERPEDPYFPAKRAFRDQSNGWPLPKSLALVPEAYRFALAYGHNPHTGQQSPAGQWRIRNVIRWVRPNPPVGALGDKFRPATSEMVVATIASDRFFDLDAVREPYSEKTNARVAQGVAQRVDLPSRQRDGNWSTLPERNNEGAGAPPLDWWKISPKGYAGAHYAVWPAELCIKPIKAMCPEKVCRECGEPSRRIVEKTPEYAAFRFAKTGVELTEARKAYHLPDKGGAGSLDHKDDTGARGQLYETTGWTDCGHNNYRPGIVLDPFAGTGTTLAVATGHGRDAIGIDIDERNALLAEERIGPMFLTIESGAA